MVQYLQATRGLKPAPIHHLANDVLFIIFSSLRDASLHRDKDASSKEKPWRWFTITHVCRQWRVMAVNTPFLWTHLRNFKDLKKTETFLERSKDAELTIFSDLQSSRYGPTTEERKCLIRALQFMGRIRSLYIDFPDSDLWKQVREFIRCPAPRLQELFLAGISDERHDLVVELPESAPFLQTLELVTLSSPRVLSFYSSLTKLTLVDIISISPSDFLSALALCPGLTELTINYLEWDNGSESLLSSTAHSVVFLEHLISLTVRIDGTLIDGLDEVLKCIRFNDGVRWKTSLLTGEIDLFLDMRFYVDYVGTISQCDVLDIIISPRFLVALSWNTTATSLTSGPDAEIRASWLRDEDPADVCALTRFLISVSRWREAKSVKLHLCLREHFVDGESLRSLLRTLPYVESLTIQIEDKLQDNGYSNVENCLNALMRQSMDSEWDLSCACACPRLEELSLRFVPPTTVPDGFIRCLTDGLRNRKRLGLDIKKVSIHSKRYSEADAQALSEYAENISWDIIQSTRST